MLDAILVSDAMKSFAFVVGTIFAVVALVVLVHAKAKSTVGSEVSKRSRLIGGMYLVAGLWLIMTGFQIDAPFVWLTGYSCALIAVFLFVDP